MTAYPGEDEVVLTESCDVHVLASRKDHLIINESVEFRDFHKKEVSLINLFQRS